MKKAVSIMLMVLLMLNVMGYYGFFIGLKYRNDYRVLQRIDADAYRDSETVTIKVPLAIPYFGNTTFERIDGEIEHQGQVYKLVKQKLERDTLHILCIKDTRATEIRTALVDYVRTFTDNDADRPGGKTIPSFIKEYCASRFFLTTSSAGWSMAVHPFLKQLALSDSYQSSPAPPPKA